MHKISAGISPVVHGCAGTNHRTIEHDSLALMEAVICAGLMGGAHLEC